MPAPLRIVVTGGAGFIGSHVVERLVERGSAVLVIDDLSHPCGARLPGGADLVEADAGSAKAAAAMAAFAPDAAIHLAAKGGVARALREPDEHVRSVLASSVAFFANAGRAGVGAVVAASSGGAVYGDAAHLPTAETTPPAPRSPYGAEKLAEEGYLGAAGRVHGYRTLSLRYGNVYGPRQDGTGEAGVVAITCHRLLDGLGPRVFGDGGQTRDFVYAGDVADATVAALLSDVTGVLNVGTGRSTSVEEVVTALVAAAGSDTPVEHLDGRAGEVRNGRLDITAITSALGWTPQTDIDTGLRRTYAWFAENANAAGPGALNRKTA